MSHLKVVLVVMVDTYGKYVSFVLNKVENYIYTPNNNEYLILLIYHFRSSIEYITYVTTYIIDQQSNLPYQID